jgi:hypothetical protein
MRATAEGVDIELIGWIPSWYSIFYKSRFNNYINQNSMVSKHGITVAIITLDKQIYLLGKTVIPGQALEEAIMVSAGENVKFQFVTILTLLLIAATSAGTRIWDLVGL